MLWRTCSQLHEIDYSVDTIASSMPSRPQTNFVQACTKAEENEKDCSKYGEKYEIEGLVILSNSWLLENKLSNNRKKLFSFYHFNTNSRRLQFAECSDHLHVISHTNKSNRTMTRKHIRQADVKSLSKE